MGLNFFFQYIVIWNIEKWLSKFYFFIPMGTCLLKNSNFDQTNCVSWYLTGILLKFKNKIVVLKVLDGLECIKVNHNFVVNFLVATPKIYNTCSGITSMWS